MFMIPTPPTSSDTDATLASSIFHRAVPTAATVLRNLRRIAKVEVVRRAGQDVMTRAEQLRELRLGRHPPASAETRRHQNIVEPRLSL